MRKILMGTALLFGMAGAGNAQGIPTMDVQSIAQQIQQIKQMLDDYGLQSDLLDNALKQLDTIDKQLDKLTSIQGLLSGKSDIVGLLMGGKLDGLLQAQTPNVLALISGGMRGDWSALTGENGAEMKASIGKVLASGGLNTEAVAAMANSGVAGEERAAAQATSAAVLSATAEASHGEAAQSLERLDTLVGSIGDTKSLKESVDLNTRVTAELGVSLAKIWELQATEAIGAGAAGVVDAATIAEEKKFMDFTMPELK